MFCPRKANEQTSTSSRRPEQLPQLPPRLSSASLDLDKGPRFSRLGWGRSRGDREGVQTHQSARGMRKGSMALTKGERRRSSERLSWMISAG